MNRAAKTFLDKVLGPQWSADPGRAVFVGRYREYDVYRMETGGLISFHRRADKMWDASFNMGWAGNPIPDWVKPFL